MKKLVGTRSPYTSVRVGSSAYRAERWGNGYVIIGPRGTVGAFSGAEVRPLVRALNAGYRRWCAGVRDEWKGRRAKERLRNKIRMQIAKREREQDRKLGR